MATTKIQKEMTGIVQNFISLWNRYYNLYLENVSRQDISAEKENEFLKFQGTIVEQLVSVLELDEKSRFDIHDKVMSVLNEVVSLDFYTRLSEFQINRTKHQWQEAMEELEKLYRFCDTYDPKVDKVERIAEVKKKNPYWDPTAGGLRDVVSRIAVAPVTFFQGIKIGVPANKIGVFVFLIFFIPVLIILTITFLLNFDTVKAVGRHSLIEAGILSSDEVGFMASLITGVAILAGLLLISAGISIVFIILHYLFSWFLHLGFKLTGARESYPETFKVASYGATPFLAAITAPYAIALQIIGGSKVHKYSYFLSAIGWIIGTVLFLAFLFVILGTTFYFTKVIPPVGARYAYVETAEAGLYSRFDGKESAKVIRGTYLNFAKPEETPKEETKNIGERPNRRKASVYEVKYKNESYYVEKDKVKIIEFAYSNMPGFIFDRSIHLIAIARESIKKKILEYSE